MRTSRCCVCSCEESQDVDSLVENTQPGIRNKIGEGLLPIRNQKNTWHCGYPLTWHSDYPLPALAGYTGLGVIRSKVLYGEALPRVTLFIYPFQQDTPFHCLSYTCYGQMLPLSHTYIHLNCCKRHQFDVSSHHL